MPSTIACNSCCTTTQSVNIPGTAGAAGAAGADGVNAYTTTTANFNVPAAPGDSVTISGTDTSWMVVGQYFVVTGPATFQVTALPSTTSVTGEWLDAPGDVAAGTAIASGSGISPCGAPGSFQTSVTDYRTGGSQEVTTTFAQIVSSNATLATAGTYLIHSQARFDFVGCTYAASQTLTAKLKETTNSSAYIANAVGTIKMEIVTALSHTAGYIVIPPVVYTATAGDTVQIFAAVGADDGGGSVQAIEAHIVAIKLS